MIFTDTLLKLIHASTEQDVAHAHPCDNLKDMKDMIHANPA